MNYDPQNTNSADRETIERIVQEVVRRILASGAVTPKSRPAPSATRETGPGDSPCIHRVASRLVTLESLRGLRGEVTQLLVAGRAVVTPAVVDELRDRGIRLVREGCAASLPATPVALGIVEGALGPGRDAVLGFGQTPIEGSLHEVLRRIRQRLQSGGRALLVTPAPGVAVYTAFQHGLRAVYGSNARDVAEAREKIDPNLLVIDCHTSPSGALESFVNEASHWRERA